MASPNETLEAEVNHLKELQAQVNRLTENLANLLRSQEWLMESVGEISSMVDRIGKLEDTEKSLAAELKASEEKNLEHQREISELQNGMKSQYDNHRELAAKWTIEKKSLEIRNNNLKTQLSGANNRVVSSKKIVGELSTKLRVLDAKILEKERDLRSKIEGNEEKLSLVTELYEISVDSFDMLMERVERVESIVDQGIIDQMKATIRSLKKKLQEQEKLNMSVDGERDEILLELQHENDHY